MLVHRDAVVLKLYAAFDRRSRTRCNPPLTCSLSSFLRPNKSVEAVEIENVFFSRESNIAAETRADNDLREGDQTVDPKQLLKHPSP